MDINAKYEQLRPLICNGDICLTHGNSLLAKTIRWSDGNAAYNHALVVFKVGDRLLCIQALAQGVVPYFLSQEILANTDFCLLQPKFSQAWKDKCVDDFFVKQQTGEKYNKFALLNILLAEKLKIKTKNDFSKEAICSTAAAWNYGALLPLKCYSLENIGKNYITPQDLLRYANKDEIEVIGNDYV